MALPPLSRTEEEYPERAIEADWNDTCEKYQITERQLTGHCSKNYNNIHYVITDTADDAEESWPGIRTPRWQ